MSRLDFLYRTRLPHRAVAVYIYLADRANGNGEYGTYIKPTNLIAGEPAQPLYCWLPRSW